MVRAQLAGERPLLGAARDRDRLHPELDRELDPEMAEAADPDALAHPPAVHALAERFDHAGDLVPRHARMVDSGKAALLDERIAVADAARVYAHERLAEAGLGDLSLDQLELAAGLAHLHCPHRWHRRSISPPAIGKPARYPPPPGWSHQACRRY